MVQQTKQNSDMPVTNMSPATNPFGSANTLSFGCSRTPGPLVGQSPTRNILVLLLLFIPVCIRSFLRQLTLPLRHHFLAIRVFLIGSELNLHDLHTLCAAKFNGKVPGLADANSKMQPKLVILHIYDTNGAAT